MDYRIPAGQAFGRARSGPRRTEHRAGLGELGVGVGGGDADHLADTGSDGGADAGRGVLDRERSRGVDAEPFAGQSVAGGVRLAVDHVVRGDDQVDPLPGGERSVDGAGGSRRGRRR